MDLGSAVAARPPDRPGGVARRDAVERVEQARYRSLSNALITSTVGASGGVRIVRSMRRTTGPRTHATVLGVDQLDQPSEDDLGVPGRAEVTGQPLQLVPDRVGDDAVEQSAERR